MSIKDLTTEQRNPNTLHIDTMSTLEMVNAINAEDQKVAEAVEKQNTKIAQAIDLASINFKKGGRLIYIGAGTSGRLGVLDAVELVPTYSIEPERAIGLIAGGKKAMFLSIEHAEDSEELAKKDLKNLHLSAKDIVLGIAASGRTPYVVGGLKWANQVGALTISLACVASSKTGKLAKVSVETVVGPEVITGSTRMKAGTAQKMVLNMISTGVMIKQGKVYQNIMIDVKPTNSKLVDRATRIIHECGNVSIETAANLLQKADMQVPVAIIMAQTSWDANKAKSYLQNANKD